MKLFLGSIEPATWKDLKEALVDEFGKDVSDFDVHTVLRETKKTKKEDCHEYLLKMIAIARPNLVDDESIIRYVIAGIDDDQANKRILYGAATIREFKAKIDAYEKFKQGFVTKRVAAKNNSSIQSRQRVNGQQVDSQLLARGNVLYAVMTVTWQDDARRRMKGSNASIVMRLAIDRLSARRKQVGKRTIQSQR